MENAFDFDKFFNDIVSNEETEIDRLRNIVEKLEKQAFKQQKIKEAKDNFHSKVADIIMKNVPPFDLIKRKDIVSPGPQQTEILSLHCRLVAITDHIQELNAPYLKEMLKKLRQNLYEKKYDYYPPGQQFVRGKYEDPFGPFKIFFERVSDLTYSPIINIRGYERMQTNYQYRYSGIYLTEDNAKVLLEEIFALTISFIDILLDYE